MQKLIPLLLLLVALGAASFFLLMPEEGGTSTTGSQDPQQEQVDPASGLENASPTLEAASLEGEEGVARADLEEQPGSGASTGSLEDAGFVTARLVDQAGRPLGGNQLKARKVQRFGNGEELSSAWSASDGSVRLQVPAGDSTQLVAQGDFWAPSAIDLAALRPGEEIAVGDIVLTPADRLVGTVTDPQGKPVAAAQVSLRDSGSNLIMGSSLHRTAFTDAEGRYELGGIPAGTYRLRATGTGFAPAILEPVIVSGRGEDVDQELRLGKGRSVVGVVLDADSRPVAGARVGPQHSLFEGGPSFVPGQRNRPQDGVLTGADGRFTLGGLDEEVETLVVRLEGFETQRAAVPAEGQEAVVRLRRSLTFAGIVVDEEGKPVADAEVRLFAEESGMPGLPGGEDGDSWDFGDVEAGRAVTGKDGRFRIVGLKAGSYRLSAYALAGQLLDAPLEVQEDLTEQEVRLEPGEHLVFYVADASGKFVAGAEIELHDASLDGFGDGFEFEVNHSTDGPGEESSSSTNVRRFGGGFQEVTGKTGHAVFFGVPEGRYTATIRAEGHAEESFDFDRQPDHQQEDVTLATAAQLVVRVVSPTKTPQPAVEIYLKRLDEKADLITEQSDSTGRVVWPRLEAGRYEVGYREAEASVSTGTVILGFGGKKKKRSHPVQEVDLIANAALEVQVEVLELALPEVLVTRSGRPVGGVEAWLEKVQSGPMPSGADINRPGTTRTDALGKALLPAKEPGKYILVVRAGRSAPQVRQDVELIAGAQEFEVAIPGGEVVGNLFADGAPLAGATLSLAVDTGAEEGSGPRTRGIAIMMVDDGDGMNVEMASGNPNDASAVSDSDGDYRFTDVPPGNWVVQCRARGYERWTSQPFTMHEDGTVDLGTQRLVKGAVLRGTDLSYDAENPATASMFGMGSILQLQDEEGETLDVAIAQSDGSYRFRDLQAGTYRVQRGEYTSDPVTLSAGEEKTLDLPKE